ncbi:S66 peptidase family protein [Nocardioides sp. LHG3406-4]|uniref:S66 peptidase family protein n=1 Tax=Nocardioides sp. LHG3406-4 TaxID=2804575 RepID=UPI003CFB349D
MSEGLQPLTRPPRLREGDKVAVVSPSGPVLPDRLEAGCEILRAWGLEVEIAPHVLDVHPELDYLAGTDRARAEDLQAAWLDPSVAGVLCARGGYGVQRMVDLLDWSAMRDADPKVFAGFSDITALHAAFASELRVATLHAPMVAVMSFVEAGHTADLAHAMLFDPESQLCLTSATAQTLVPGVARGVTVGGCLSLLASEPGTPHARRSAAGGIVLLEDVGEDRYRLDGFLTHLLRSGWFDGVTGIALGSWLDCEDGVRELMLDRLGGLGVPVVWELGFGHGTPSLTVPLGVPATLDADAGTLTLDVPALL